MKILITEPVNEKGIELLKEHGYEIAFGTGADEETLIKEAKGCQGVLTRNGKFTKEVMDALPELKVIAMHGVGVDCIDVDAATKKGIQVTNAAGSNQEAVAEYTIGLILMLAKKSIDYNNEFKVGNMEVRKCLGEDVCGKTLGIIGMGNIGTRVAKIAHNGLGMKVIGYNRHIVEDEETGYCTLTPDMKKLISESDYLSLHLPATAQTAKIIGEKELLLMKPTAYLINTGRGEVVDEKALIKVLHDKKIKGAALDVFEGNLPKRDNPLLTMDNVIATPHTAAFTIEALERMSYQAALGITEVLEDKPVSFPVNHLKSNFETDKNISIVMDYFRYEFGYSTKEDRRTK